jgi:hypothetical protein
MPAKSTHNGTPPAVLSGDPSAGRQDAELTADGRQPPANSGASGSGRIPPTDERLTAERAERRRQRTAAREAPTSPRAPREGRRGERPTESTTATMSPGRLTLRDSAALTVIAVLVAGGVLGAILGALSASGLVIGVLVAGLTMVLSAWVRRYSRST